MRQEEEEIFQTIFEENCQMLFQYIYGQLNPDRETAKDILYDVWEVLIVKFERVMELDDEERTKWLFGVAKNKIRNQRRKQYYQKEISYMQICEAEEKMEKISQVEERMVMQKYIQNLKPKDQKLFWGRIYGFSYKELSHLCEKSEQALQCQYSRMIKKLQAMMTAEAGR